MTGTQRERRQSEARAPNLRLIELRFEAGLSQRRLAFFAGLNPSVVQLAEKGWVPHPRNAGAILDVLEQKLGRQVRYVDVFERARRG